MGIIILIGKQCATAINHLIINNQMPSSTMRDPYSIVQSSNGNARNPTDIRKYLIYGGLALVAIIAIKFLVKR